jgi:hypothetical protein
LYADPSYKSGDFARVRAKLLGRDMLPLAQNTRIKAQIKPPAGVTIQPSFELAAEPSQGTEWNGWFEGRFRVLSPGPYQVDVQIPESGDLLTKRFLVKESNPELDNTRPDFGQLYLLASEVTDFLPRMDPSAQAEVKKALEETSADMLHQIDEQAGEDARRGLGKEKAGKADVKRPAADREALRFFFNLTSAKLIPKCMVTESKVQRSRGPVKDLWDQGFTISEDPRIRMATVLVLVALLLSGEWLTRKLLRLA